MTLDVLRYEASLWDTFPGIVEKGGGRDRLLACGNVYSGPFQTQMVAYEMGIHGIDVGALGTPARPGVVFRTKTAPDQPDRAQAHRRSHAPGRHQRALAARDRPALRCPRARLPLRRSRRAARAPAPATPELRSSR